MARIVLTPKARADLLDIWTTIALDNPAAADRLLRRIAAKFEALADFPALGTPRPEIAPTTRVLVEGNYLILYEPHDDDLVVIRVLHGARDLSSLL